MNTQQRSKSQAMVGANVHSFERARILRALKARVRYRYVKPQVLREGQGWRIVSPCCSRNVDPEGGIIDIALLVPRRGVHAGWRLMARDHTLAVWVLHSEARQLDELLEAICQDPRRVFWP